jgi:hypothetical protein
MSSNLRLIFFGGIVVFLIFLALAIRMVWTGPASATAAQPFSPQNVEQEEQDDPGEGEEEPGGGEELDATEIGAAHKPVPITRDDFTRAFPVLSPAQQPGLFVECVDNTYFPLIPGTVYHLEEQTDEGLETITITVTNQTRAILGIQATVVHDSVQLEGELIEDTEDWFAQDDRGNVWYLGESTAEYEDGEVVSTEGSWEAGVDGAVPGLIMVGDPRPGDLYFQEYLEGEAEDMGAVMSLAERVRVPYGSFANALQTADYNPLDDQLENKWYAPGVGVVKEALIAGRGAVELLSITHDGDQIILDGSCGEEGGVSFVGSLYVEGDPGNPERLAKISPQEAETAVLSTIQDATVRKTELGMQDGFLVYWVSLESGELLIVDAGDGAVLDRQ